MRIDAHHHLWRYDAAEFDWIDDRMAAIRRDFLPETFAPVLQSANLDGCVAVQARQSVAETEFLLETARHHRRVRGVVGWAPLADPGVGALLDHWAGDALFKGVRHVVQGETDPAFLERPAFNAGLREVTARGLSYDLLIRAHQLPAAIAFVDRHPAQRFVLDHAGKPCAAGRPPAEWCRWINELARRPHVSCKFSGLVTEVPGWTWTEDLLQPYFDTVLAAFGPRRVMFGSDWPVCLVATDYRHWADACARFTSTLAADEQSAFWGDNAVAFYRLQPC